MRVAVGLMAKAPVSGEVKTRLCPPLHPDEARDAAVAMLQDAAAHAVASGAEVWCVHTGDPSLLTPHLPPETSLLLQRGSGLAQRLDAAQQDLHTAGYDRVLLVGGDCPTLDAAYLRAAIDALEHVEVVLGPAVDGGYTVIGSAIPTPTLFEVAMSTSQVLDETVAQAAAAGFRVQLLDERGDVDTVDDLEAALRSGWLDTAPRTAALATSLVRDTDRAASERPGG